LHLDLLVCWLIFAEKITPSVAQKMVATEWVKIGG
jgi:hypothetical protein